MTNESKRVGTLLGRILEKQYPNANDTKGVLFDDLLGWHMWPIFITIFGILHDACVYKCLVQIINARALYLKEGSKTKKIQLSVQFIPILCAVILVKVHY